MTPLTLPQARVLMALVAVYARDGRATVRSVGECCGHRSPNTTQWHLRRLAAAGWVAFDGPGSLRPLAGWVSLGLSPEPGTLAGQTSGPGERSNAPRTWPTPQEGADVPDATHPPRHAPSGVR